MIHGAKRNSLLVVMPVLLAWAVVMAAAGGNTASKRNARTKVGRLSLGQLKNMTYKVEDATHGEVPLHNGEFEDEPYEPGAASRLEVRFGDRVAHGDLDGDGTPDAAVILWVDPGGSGTFVHLALVLNQNGKPSHVASELLGDRVKVKSLCIKNRIVTVDMLTQGPNDPMCEPRQRVLRRYTLNHGALVPVGSESP
jgi:hypothetical protein